MITHSIHLKYRTPKSYPTIISIVPPGVALIIIFRGSNYAVSNKFSWSTRGSSHRSSTVCRGYIGSNWGRGWTVHPNLALTVRLRTLWVLMYDIVVKYSRLSLSRTPRDSIKHFKISVLRHIRFAELRKTINRTITFDRMNKFVCLFVCV